MKRNVLLIAAALLGLTATNAQRLTNNDARMTMHQMEATPTMQKADFTKKAKMDSKQQLAIYGMNTLTKKKNVQRREGEEEQPELIAWYAMPEGSFFRGMTNDWMAYNRPVVSTPALQEQKFLNSSYTNVEGTPVEYTWTLALSSKDSVLVQDENNDASIAVWGYYDAPVLSATQGDLSDSHQLQSYGQQTTTTGYWFAGTDTIEALSNACSAMGFWSGFSDVEETFTSGTIFRDSLKVVGFAETFEAPTDTVYATSIHVTGWLENITDETDFTNLLGDNELVAELHLLGENGINPEPFITAFATSENIDLIVEPQGRGYSGITINFPFTKEDDLFGTVETGYVLPKEEFVVILKGFENLQEGNFCVPFSSAYDGGAYLVRGNGYALLEDGSLATIGYTRYPDTPQINLHIMINAAIPVAESYLNTPPTIEFATTAEEGEETVMGVTGYDPDDGEPFGDIYVLTGTAVDEENGAWQVDGPDWVTGFSYDNSLFEDYNVVTFWLEAEPLPEGVEGRSGEVSFILYGKEVRFPVVQGTVDGIEGIHADKKNLQNSSVFNLNGQRVNANVKGLLIKNGKKFINK